jgi:hypothetical protein
MKKKKIPREILPSKPYVPLPHPMQHRLDEFRVIPSMWNGKITESKQK